MVGFAAAGLASFALTPVAIRVAARTEFLDRPRDYRKHAAPTPFLGGAAVLFAILVAALVVGVSGRLWILLGTATALWALGTIDDRFAVAPKWRLLADSAAAIVLVAAGLGWNTTDGDTIDALVSVVWVVGLVNAFNLMDNMDGACGTVGCVSAAGVGLIAVVHGQPALAGLSFAVAGACGGFLPWNLAGPAKIFLGDGGSMPIGFLVSALAMVTLRHVRLGDTNVLAGALLVGVPILDTALVSLSRTRRGVPLVTGGRDHLTHRLRIALRTPRAVAAALALTQATLCTFAVAGDRIGNAGLTVLAAVSVSFGIAAIVLLDSSRWRPPDIAVGPARRSGQTAGAPSVSVDSG